LELEGKKVLMLCAELFNEYEMIYPYYRLQEAGAEVKVAAPEAERVYASKSGLGWRSDLAASQLDAAQWDGLVIPGGYAPDHMRRHPAMVDIVRAMCEADKVVAAICHAGWMLASAGVLAGRQVTSFFAIKDDLVHAGALWRDAEVVVDDRLITSRQPEDLPAFMREVVAALA